jgi:hypothetical protein
MERIFTFSFWQKWLLAVAIIITTFGVIMTFVSGTPLFNLFNQQINPVFWGANAVDVPAKQFQQWVYGVLGATMAGWGIFIASVAHHPFRKKEKWAWNCIAFGLVVWFILDTSLSYFHKVYFNVAFNTVLFILAMLPVIFTRKDFD